MSPMLLPDDSSSPPQPAIQTLCPVCSGPLCVTPDQSRCMRCQFKYCPDCDGGPVENDRPD